MSTNLEQFRKAQNADLAERVKEIRAVHPSWSYDRAFTFALEQNPELSQVTASGRFARTQVPGSSRLAMAVSQAPDGQNDFPADDGTGWRNAMKQFAREMQDSASPQISLIPSKHRRLIGKMLQLLGENPTWSQDQALSKALELDPSLAEREDSSASARHVTASYGEDPYRTDPFYHQPEE